VRRQVVILVQNTTPPHIHVVCDLCMYTKIGRVQE
jgi:hypothetical protein